jgi:hypothetical protein
MRKEHSIMRRIPQLRSRIAPVLMSQHRPAVPPVYLLIILCGSPRPQGGHTPADRGYAGYAGYEP